MARRTAGLMRAHVDESSVVEWEPGKTRPFPAAIQRLNRLFTKIGWPFPEFEPETLYGPEHRAEAAHRSWRARAYADVAGS